MVEHKPWYGRYARKAVMIGASARKAAAVLMVALLAVPACGSASTSDVSGLPTSAGSSPAGPASAPLVNPGGPKILIVADSIGAGMLGDYTWRYRLWQDLQSAHVNFVGHRTGTENIYDDPADLATVSGHNPPSDNYADPMDGYYSRSVDPEFLRSGDHHDALWGWTYHLAKDYVAQDISAYRPDYLLVELGFDDLAFGGASPDAMLADIMALVHNARVAEPGIKILLANVVTRTPLPALPDLDPTVATFNAALAAAVPGWSAGKSPVKLVDISSRYNPSTDSYDGVHPNGEGEYLIADAFATVLAQEFGVGHVPGPPPASVPGITLTAPGSVNASISGNQIVLQWGRVYGASGYNVFRRDITGKPSTLPAFTELPLQVQGDRWLAGSGLPGHTYQYQVAAARGTNESSPSSPVTLTVPPG
jgi:hypothetical protein